jgi:hypothetical protein
MNISAGKCLPHLESQAERSVKGGAIRWLRDMIGDEIEFGMSQKQNLVP